ncbi:hypothetical protein F511_39823 [Dorcoceras hygrometricum]|uniref:Uncharacterized protein n=1 Tax=Dorcoceras hygrometricum TaxID=472368 RepID=A0A2Z7BE92_9LAMI|nr:hypothetical protein F511_39823 [Dorcoceras hygrometricum]
MSDVSSFRYSVVALEESPIFLISIFKPSFYLLFTERFFPRFLSITAFVFDDFGGAGFLVSCSVDCYSLEVVERLVEVSVKLLVYEDFWRNLIDRSLIVVRFWIFSSRESLPYFPSQERSGCLGRELQRLVRTLLRYLWLEGSSGNQAGPSGVPAGRSPFP